jgi:hypothetical protein
MAYETPAVDAITLTGLDATTSFTTIIDTTDMGCNFSPITVNFECTEGVVISSVPTVAVGFTAPKYEDILTATPLTVNAQLVPGSNQTFTFSPNPNVSSVPEGTNLYISVLTPAQATTYTLRVSVMGIYYTP